MGTSEVIGVLDASIRILAIAMELFEIGSKMLKATVTSLNAPHEQYVFEGRYTPWFESNAGPDTSWKVIKFYPEKPKMQAKQKWCMLKYVL